MQYVNLKHQLEFLRRGGIPRREEGICDLLREIVRRPEVTTVMTIAVEHWDAYSGSETFPIHDPKYPYDMECARDAFTYASNLWDKRTKYGKLRYELVQRMIDVIDDINNSPS